MTLNELRISNPSPLDDTSNFVELFGTPGESLDGQTLLVVSSEFEPGQIDFAFDLTGGSFDEDGFFLLANPGSGYDFDPGDITASFDFFGSPVTFFLVEGFTGAAGDDLDTDNDGTPDVTPWTAVLDSVALIDGDDTPDLPYSELQIGPDGDFTPAGAKATEDGAGLSEQLAFSDNSGDTPGFTNVIDVSGPFREIWEIQGAGHVSPFVDLDLAELPEDTGSVVGEAVTTAGVVTALESFGFFMQDPEGDGDIATSDAIFVVTGGAPDVAVGDRVSVGGQVAEFFPGGTDTRNLPLTQIVNAQVTVVEVGPTVFPTATLLGEGGRILPDQVIDDDAFAEFQPALDGIDFFESIESMLVTVDSGVAISPTNRFGELFIVTDPEDASGISDRGTLNISPDDFNPEKIQLDADFQVSDGFQIPVVDTGVQVSNIEGVISYDFGNYQIVPTMPFDVTEGPLLVPDETELAGDADTLTVATYNVLNLDPVIENIENVDEQDANDVDDDVGDGRFDAIAAQIVGNMGAPDIIGLQEVQDSDGAEITDVTDATLTLQTLVDAIVAAGGPEYAFIDTPGVPADQIIDGEPLRPVGGQPGGLIRNAFLYNPERVDLVEGSVTTILDGDDDPFPFFAGRIPLSAEFAFGDETVTVVSNHFSSKGGSAPILGVEQPFDARQEDPTVNGSLDERQVQAEAVNAFVDDILEADASANVVVLGDLNEFEFVSPVSEILPGTGADAILVNTTDFIDEDERYTFNFQGNSQSLDHVLVSNGLSIRADVDIVNVNSEFAETSSRASDHDPIVTALNFDGNEAVAFGTGADDTLAGTDASEDLGGLGGDDLLLGSGGSDFVSGGTGEDTLRYATTSDTVGRTLLDSGDVLFAKPDGNVDTVRQVERVDFEDVDILYGLDSPNLGYAYRSYQAAFDRIPDEEGFLFNLDALDDGLPRQESARNFINSDEFVAQVGQNITDDQFVAELYINVLDRFFDDGGFAYWTDLLDQGLLDRPALFNAFVESPENVAGTAPFIDNGVVVLTDDLMA
ncbi:MAG: DUF4214 domain-containing protein [Paracoccaceae bacterium]